MSPREGAVLVFVAVGLQAGIFAAVVLFTTALGGNEGLSLRERIITLIPSVFLAWISYQLLRHRLRFAHRVFPEAASHAGGIAQRDLAILAVSFIGLFFAVLSMPSFLAWVVEVPRALRGGDPAGVSPFAAARLVPALAGVVVGALVLANRQTIADRLFGDPAREDAERD